MSRIAVIGSGISGLGSAWLLSKHYDVTVFEAEPRLGGHTATVDVELNGRQYAIDTGFIVYNDATYPNFIRLMDELGVENQTTSMGFSVRCYQTGLEYAGNNLNTLFGQRKNLVSPYFLKLVRDILRFNKEAKSDLDSGVFSVGATLGDYLSANNYSQGFIQHYLIPMGAAIWSASTQTMLNFPVLFFVRFFDNHGLLKVGERPQWRTLIGGSRSYIPSLSEPYKENIRLDSPVTSVRRFSGGVEITSRHGVEHFDKVVFACHSDQALHLLSDASPLETEILSAIPYEMNDVVLHTDIEMLPKVKRCWSSWNYLLTDYDQAKPALTYNMNILQNIRSDETFCVTLNHVDTINPEKVIGRYQYAHPVFTLDGIAAQQRWSEISRDNTWFCGAYWANGFHEDGFTSAIRVAEGLGIKW